ncbi:MAG TPA: response regulator transcription factor [Dehalococcoidia bacterium]|nr:response regulator transcription factor [Dehalococcoidia bacterium]
MQDKTTVLLVDDHALFREGLAALLSTQDGIEIVGEAASGEEALEKARELLPDVILMDILMPGMGGLDATRKIKEEMPHTRIVMLTVSEEEEDLFEAIKAGAEGYLLKTVKSRDLVDMLLGVLRGEVALSRVIARKLWEEFAEQSKKQEAPSLLPPPNLTRREMEVLRFLSEGFPDKAIASRLGISQRTVKNHVHNILAKLQLQNRVQAAAYALRQGLVKET